MTPVTHAESLPSLGELLWLPACAAAFFLPGRALTGKTPGAPGWALAFAATFALLVNLALALDGAGLAIGRCFVLTPLAGSLIWLLARGELRWRPGSFGGLRKPDGRACFVFLASALLVAGLAWSLTRTPLSHWDNFFRWNHLALLLKSTGSFAHYPPVSDADYAVYPWSDGIPPGVAVLNAAIYMTAGSVNPLLLLLRAGVELALILGLTRHLARELWGDTGPVVALPLLATSALFASALAMNQEVGLSAVFALLLATLLHDQARRPSDRGALHIGLAAGAIALVRDYNLAYIPAALVLMLGAQPTRRRLLLAAGMAVLVAGPWYARNAWLTGNPLYPHSLGGLLAGNRMNDVFVAALRLRSGAAITASISAVGTYALHLAAGIGVVALAALPIWFRVPKLTRPLWGLALTAGLLWLLTFPIAGGGWLYAARVLAVVAPLAAVSAGAWPLPRSRVTRIVAAGICLLLATDAAWRGRRYFDAPLASPLEQEQPDADRAFLTAWDAQTEVLRTLAAIARQEGILLEQPNHAIAAADVGAKVFTLFSPAARSLATTSTGDAHDVARRLRAEGIRFAVFTRNARLLLRNTPPLVALLGAAPTADLGPIFIYDLALLAGESPAIRLAAAPSNP